MAKITTPDMQELLSAGAHFGHKASRAHPKMKEYIFGSRDGVDIIDLAKTEEKLKSAVQAAFELGKQNKSLLILGTKKQAKDVVEELAKEVGAYYLSIRWVGGLLTNFEEISKNFRRLNALKDEQQKGQLSRYTKKEQLLISRKLEKFNNELGGVANMPKIPDALFVVDAVSDNTGVTEAQKMNLTILGICDTNSNPYWFDYPVPANDDGIKSIKMICEAVIKAYGEGKKEVEKKVAEDSKEQPKTDDVKTPATPKTPEDAAVVTEPDEVTAVLEEEVEKKILSEQERKA